MDAEQLHALQNPLKARYREQPQAAVITLSTSGKLGQDSLTCQLETGKARVEAGLHPATGGDGSTACSGDMLLEALLAELGIAREQFAHRSLPLFREPAHLVVVETDAEGRAHRLVPEAAAAWYQLSAAAAQDGVRLVLVSAFRNLQQQAEIIRWKCSRGLSVEEILLGSAPPGYSEHHTGRAVDISNPGCPPWDEAFEHTEAYRWLSRYANSFGFSLSFPRGNRYGYVFEPWHWCHEEVTRSVI